MAFIDVLRNSAEDNEAESEGKLSSRAAEYVCRFFKLEVSRDAEFGLTWFHENYAGFPVRLESRRIKTTITELFQKPSKTKLWKEFQSIRGENSVALIVPLTGCGSGGLFVMHNCFHVSSNDLAVRMVYGCNRDDGFIFEGLQSFLLGIQQRWSP
jgi:hypothetical protein